MTARQCIHAYHAYESNEHTVIGYTNDVMIKCTTGTTTIINEYIMVDTRAMVMPLLASSTITAPAPLTSNDQLANVPVAVSVVCASFTAMVHVPTAVSPQNTRAGNA